MSTRHLQDLPIKALRAFIAINEHGSFSKAAKALKLTQPAISLRLSALEKLVGGDLFFKSGGAIRLTALGEAVIRRARRMVALNDQMVSSVGQTLNAETIRLGIQTILIEAVTPALVQMRDIVSDVSYKFVCSNARDLSERREAGYLDLVCMLLPPIRQNILTEWTERVVWVRAPHAFDASLGNPIPLVGRHEGLMNGQIIQALDEKDVSYQFEVHTSDMAGMTAFVRAGLGVMVTPERCIPDGLVPVQHDALPVLPDLHFGIFHKEGFDLARHKSLVSAFTAAVRPPSATLVKLPEGRARKG